MTLPLEAVPNFSDGRNPATIGAIGAALALHADVLDVHSDPDHNRSVFTLVADDQAIVDALVAGVSAARDRIDLAAHDGVHPLVGAADVVPIVPIEPSDMERAKAAARELAGRVGELGLPVFLYGELASGRGPAFFRKGGRQALADRMARGELAPDFGPAELHPTAGAVLVGARRPLIAFNVNLRGSLDSAREIAALIRDGAGRGFPGVRALGLDLPRAGVVQVSMNVEDWEMAALDQIVARIEYEAAARGAEVLGCELVGLIPAGAAIAAASIASEIAGFDSAHILELRLLERAAGIG